MSSPPVPVIVHVTSVKLRAAGVWSTLPATSVARTANVCFPGLTGPTAAGDVHGANAAPSSRHSNVDPGSSAENVNVALGSVTGPSGPDSIVVCGAVVSSPS
jgi:hypothetical protein